jgi:hypothetical protein
VSQKAAQPAAGSAGAGPAKAEASHPYRTAIDELRSTARWLITTFAAVAGVLLAGVQLTGIGELEGDELTGALICAAVAIVGVALAIHGAARVLTTRSATPGALLTSKEAKKLHEAVAEDPFLLRGQAADLAQLIDRYRASMTTAVPANAGYTKEAVARTVMSLTRTAVYLRVRQVFGQSLAWIFVGALLTAAGAVGFAYFSNPPDEEKKKSAPTLAAPSRVDVRLTAAGEQLFGKALGEGCTQRPVAALVLGGTVKEPDVVTLPTTTCTSQRVVLTRDLGVAVAKP